MHTMKTNLANIKNVLAAWDRPLMERKPKPVDRDEFERAHRAIKSSRYAEIKEGGKVQIYVQLLSLLGLRTIILLTYACRRGISPKLLLSMCTP